MDRSDLDRKLVEILGSEYVYFQPPESVKLHYPCIVYELRSMNTRHADDDIYQMADSYLIKLITRDADTSLRKGLLRSFHYIRFDRSFRSDNLYHYTYILYHN